MSSQPTVSVVLPPALVRLFPGSAERVEVSAANVREAIEAVNVRWPGMRDRLVDSTPRIRRNIIVFVDGKRAGLDTAVAPGAAVIVRMGMIG